jgi:hypothetical protein
LLELEGHRWFHWKWNAQTFFIKNRGIRLFSTEKCSLLRCHLSLEPSSICVKNHTWGIFLKSPNLDLRSYRVIIHENYMTNYNEINCLCRMSASFSFFFFETFGKFPKSPGFHPSCILFLPLHKKIFEKNNFDVK